MQTITINEGHLGSEATEAEARAMVELLNEHGYTAEYGIAAQSRLYLVPDDKWFALMPLAIERAKKQQQRHTLTFSAKEYPDQQFAVSGETFGKAVIALITELELRYDTCPENLWECLDEIHNKGESSARYYDLSDPENAFEITHSEAGV